MSTSVSEMSGRTRVLLRVWLLTGLACTGAYFVVGRDLRGWILVALNLSAAGVLAMGAKGRPEPRRFPGYLRALGLGIYGLGNVVWVASNHLSAFPQSVVLSANLLYGAGYAVLIGGTLLGARRLGLRNLRGYAIDALITMAGTAVLWWLLLVKPVASDPKFTGLEQVVAGIYPSMDVLVLGLVCFLMLLPAWRGPGHWLFASALGLMLVGDAAYNLQSVNDAYVLGGPADAAWLVAFVTFGLASLWPSPSPVDQASIERKTLGYGRIAWFVAAALAGPVGLAIVTLNHGRVQMPVFVASSVGLFLLVLFRMAGLLRSVQSQMGVLDDQRAALKESEERYRSVVNGVNDVIFQTDGEGRLTFLNAAWARLTGIAVDEGIGRPLVEFVHPEDRHAAAEALQAVLSARHQVRLQLRCIAADGGPRWFEIVLGASEGGGAPDGASGSLIDITDRKQLEEQLVHQAFHDPLTGLANRALFSDRVRHALTRQQRSETERLAVLFIDLDNFKNVNDSLGHAAGDELLRVIAERLNASLRTSDTAARLGGDEFAVLLEDATLPSAMTVARRLLSIFQEPLSVGTNKLFTNGSIGIAMSTGAEKASDLLRNADTAMYEAKQRGKGRYEVFEQRMHSGVVRRLAVQADLQRALEADEITLHYQPVFRLDPVELVGTEALVRWAHPDRGLIMPGEFIGVAEETGLIAPIGDVVLDKAFRQLKRWHELRSDHSLKMAVNISAHQLQLPDIETAIANHICASGLSTESIILEITESALMNDPEAIAARLERLRELGVHIAIDDFGTGYSSLSYLRRFPVEILKVDRYFVQGIDAGPEEAAYARAIVRLGHSLGLDVVGEGIERIGELDELRKAGCDFGQGYMLSRPLPADKFESMMMSGAWNAGASQLALRPA